MTALPPPPPEGNYPPPPPGGYRPAMPANNGVPPNNYLVWAIITTIMCCLPFGIVSIVKSAEVNSNWAAGDIAGAHESSAAAKKWAIVSAIAAGAAVVLYVVVIGLSVGLSSTY